MSVRVRGDGETLKWVTDAGLLAICAGLGPVSQRDVDLLLLSRRQGMSAARAVKFVFSIRWAYMRMSGKVKTGAGNYAISHHKR